MTIWQIPRKAFWEVGLKPLKTSLAVKRYVRRLDHFFLVFVCVLRWFHFCHSDTEQVQLCLTLVLVTHPSEWHVFWLQTAARSRENNTVAGQHQISRASMTFTVIQMVNKCAWQYHCQPFMTGRYGQLRTRWPRLINFRSCCELSSQQFWGAYVFVLPIVQLRPMWLGPCQFST